MTKIFTIVALTLELAVIIWLAHSEDLGWISPFLILIVLAAIVLTSWPYGAFIALVSASAMPHFYAEFHGWKARPEHVVLFLMGLVALIRLLLRKSTVRLVALDWLVITYLTISYVSSTFMSVQPSSTLKWALLYNFAMLPYFFFRFFATDLGVARKIFNVVLVVGMAEAAYGIVCMLSHVTLGTTLGVDPGQYGFVPGTYGTQFEANLFGSYTAAAAAMFFSIFLVGEPRTRRWAGIGFLVTAMGTLTSLSRGALLALLVGCGFVLWIGDRDKASVRKKVMACVAGVAILALIALPLTGNFLLERFATIDARDLLSDQTSAVRLIQVQSALPDILRHPILGNGADSFQLNFDWTDFVHEWDIPGYLPGTLLRVLYDTGVVGLIAFLGIIICTGKRLWKAIHVKGEHAAIPLALSAGCIVYAVAFIASDATILAYSWVHMGLAVSVSMLLDRSEPLNINVVTLRTAT